MIIFSLSLSFPSIVSHFGKFFKVNIDSDSGSFVDRSEVCCSWSFLSSSIRPRIYISWRCSGLFFCDAARSFFFSFFPDSIEGNECSLSTWGTRGFLTSRWRLALEMVWVSFLVVSSAEPVLMNFWYISCISLVLDIVSRIAHSSFSKIMLQFWSAVSIFSNPCLPVCLLVGFHFILSLHNLSSFPLPLFVLRTSTTYSLLFANLDHNFLVKLSQIRMYDFVQMTTRRNYIERNPRVHLFSTVQWYGKLETIKYQKFSIFTIWTA